MQVKILWCPHIALAAFVLAMAGPAHAEDPTVSCADVHFQKNPVTLPRFSANNFLDSLGVNLHIDQGYDSSSYIKPLKYLGIRQVRDGSRHTDSMISLARATGVRFSMISGGEMDEYLSAARSVAEAGALLAVEGPNEPNNYPITYKGQRGGGSFGWLPVAKYQKDLYQRVKADPVLSRYPVFAPSEVGAETENVGLQFLTIPEGAPTVMPEGTRYADFANVHNYVSAVNGGYDDNQAWNAADPTLRDRWDGLSGNNGVTWNKNFPGYSNAELEKLPRVTTETGYDARIDATEQRLQGIVLVNNYLAQFARGWAYTYIYELRDNEGGESRQGLYIGDQPKIAAYYIHNLTTLLADRPGKSNAVSGSTVLFASDAPTIHALSFTKANGKHSLVIWGELASGSDTAAVYFAQKRSVDIYDVTEGVVPVKTIKNAKTLCINIRDHALILDY